MDQRPLGRTGIQVSSVGFGCSRIGGTFERTDRREALQILRRAFEEGINFFDTADIYAQGNSERLLAEAHRCHRNEIVIATKGGYRLSGAGRVATMVKPLAPRVLRFRPGWNKRIESVRASQMSQDFSPRHLERALDESLRRLQTDYIDLYQLHNPPAAVLANGEAIEMLQRMQEAGKIRSFGVACTEPAHALLCLNIVGLSAVQISASIVRTASLEQVIPALSGTALSVIARSPLASGLLARDVTSWSARDFRGDRDALTRALERMDRVRAFGTPRDVGLRYIAQHEGITSVLIATTRIAHLNEDLRVLTSPPLSTIEMRAIDESISNG